MNEHVEDELDLYALGALEPAEQAIVEEHLAECAQCRAQLQQSKRVIAALAWTPPQHEPPPAVLERVLARTVGRTAESPRVRAWWQTILPVPTGPQGRSRMLAWAGTIAAALLLVSTITLQRQVSKLQREQADQQEIVALLSEPRTRVAAFQDSGSPIHGHIAVSPAGTQIHLALSNLPALPANQTYQLWLINGATPESAGIFQTDAQGTANVLLKLGASIPTYQVAGITIEPAGGSATPSGKPILTAPF